MKMNDPILDSDGRLAKLISLPIPGRHPPNVILLYPDGAARLWDLALCRPVADEPADAVVDSTTEDTQ